MAEKGVLERLRDRRYKERQRIEEIFDRKTILSILVVMPLTKSVELAILSRFAYAGRFFLAFLAMCALSVYWHRLAEGAANVAEAVDGDGE